MAGRKRKDLDKLVPKFTLEILLNRLPQSQRVKFLNHSQTLVQCDRKVLWKIRFTAAPTLEEQQHGLKSYSPESDVLKRIADFLAVPLDSMYNKTRQKIINGEQLEVLPTNETKVVQLEIREQKKKRATG